MCSSSAYRFVTIWRVNAPLRDVWHVIYNSGEWPEWWPGVASVISLQPGDAQGIGQVKRLTWKSMLPYRLTFDMTATRIEPHALLEGHAMGELSGVGTWHFAFDGTDTVVRYEWHVITTRRWMNWLAPIARPLFRWNHDVVMGWGARGLAKRLGVTVTTEVDEPLAHSPYQHDINGIQ